MISKLFITIFTVILYTKTVYAAENYNLQYLADRGRILAKIMDSTLSYLVLDGLGMLEREYLLACNEAMGEKNKSCSELKHYFDYTYYGFDRPMEFVDHYNKKLSYILDNGDDHIICMKNNSCDFSEEYAKFNTDSSYREKVYQQFDSTVKLITELLQEDAYFAKFRLKEHAYHFSAFIEDKNLPFKVDVDKVVEKIINETKKY